MLDPIFASIILAFFLTVIVVVAINKQDERKDKFKSSRDGPQQDEIDAIKRRRLHELEKSIAIHGVNVEPSLIIERDKIENELGG